MNPQNLSMTDVLKALGQRTAARDTARTVLCQGASLKIKTEFKTATYAAYHVWLISGTWPNANDLLKACGYLSQLSSKIDPYFEYFSDGSRIIKVLID